MAFRERGGALAVVGVGVGSVLRGSDHGLVGILVGEVDVGFFLEGDEFDLLALDGARGDFGVLRFEVVGEFGAVVAAVALSEDAEVAVLVLGKLGVEGLDESPDIGSGSDSGSDLIITVGEAGAYWLVDVEHVGELVERVGVQRRR